MVTDEQGGLRAPGAVNGERDGTSATAVREVLAALDDLDRTPLLEHAPLFEGVHAGLHSLLTEPER